VTRLGESSPIGRLSSFGSFFENYRRSPNFWATFFPRKKLCIKFDKNGLVYIYMLGNLFTKRRNAVVIESAWRADDPGSNPSRVLGSMKIIAMLLLLWIPLKAKLKF
jgi:hypothetical protein